MAETHQMPGFRVGTGKGTQSQIDATSPVLPVYRPGTYPSNPCLYPRWDLPRLSPTSRPFLLSQLRWRPSEAHRRATRKAHRVCGGNGRVSLTPGPSQTHLWPQRDVGRPDTY